MKSEEKSIQAISAQAHGEAADNRLLRKKLLARDKRVEELEAMVSSLNKQLCEKVDQLNGMMQKLVAFMTGNGEVTLSDSLREAVVAGIRAEYEACEKQLKGIKDGDNPQPPCLVAQTPTSIITIVNRQRVPMIWISMVRMFLMRR